MDKPLTPLTDERRAGLANRESDAETAPRRAGKEDYRTRQQRDRDRILYSAALHRLAYITQVTAPELGHTFHNRLIHTLKVAQVGRRNAERLKKLAEQKQIVGAAATIVDALDPDAVEASCLAHDLGHPPFGHVAEQALHEVAEERANIADGFEGNAQSFRIVTRLAVREPHQEGLDLTRQTLDGLLKYPWRHWPSDAVHKGKRTRKWGYYKPDERSFRFARAAWPEEERETLPERSFEAELMDWADDLTYAVHDVDDFFRAGLVPLDRLVKSGAESKRFLQLLVDAQDADPDAFPSYQPDELVGAAQGVLDRERGPMEPYAHATGHRAAMRTFGSKLITNYLDAFSLEDDPVTGKVKLRIDDDALLEVTALKMLVTVYVIRRPGLAVVQHGQQRVVKDLFGWYFDASAPGKGKGDQRLFPPSAKERLFHEGHAPDARARVVIDLIAGLTETAAIQLHRGLCGGSAASALDATALIG